MVLFTVSIFHSSLVIKLVEVTTAFTFSKNSLGVIC